MISVSYDIDDESLRLLANLEQRYSAWISAERMILPGRLAWKTVSGADYLYRLRGGKGNGRSLGVRGPHTETLFDDAARARDSRDSLWATLRREGAIYRTLRLPRISSEATNVLRQLDRHALLGDTLMVVGTNAMAAYEIEAASRFASAAGVDSTLDFDMTWVANDARPTTFLAVGTGPRTLLDVLKQADSTYTINSERTFQLRNADGYEVELLVPASLEGKLPSNETMNPTALREQDWLLPGRRIEHVVCGLDGLPAKLVAPDPRRFALLKLWLAKKPTRNPLKKAKDVKQGALLLTAIEERMPHYPLDKAFRDELPAELVVELDGWQS